MLYVRIQLVSVAAVCEDDPRVAAAGFLVDGALSDCVCLCEGCAVRRGLFVSFNFFAFSHWVHHSALVVGISSVL
jgi:hypothetical protein